MPFPLLLALVLGAAWAWKLFRLHLSSLPGSSFFVLRCNGALQGLIGAGVGTLAVCRALGIAGDVAFLRLEGQREDLVRFGASAALATSIPLVLVHLVALLVAWRWRKRDAVHALGFASGSWALAALLVSGLELGPGFFPRAASA